MFKLTKNPVYTWPVTVSIPQDGGKFLKATFTAEFRGLSQPEIDAAVQAGRDGDTDLELCSQCLLGWKGVQDEDGQEKLFSDAAKAELLAVPYVRNAVVQAFFDSLTGGASRRKN